MADGGPAGRRLRPGHRAGSAGLRRPSGSGWCEAGCIVTETAARPPRVAAAIATGDRAWSARTCEREPAVRRPRVALVTYSTKPRGGVVHTLSLAEAMADAGDAGARRRARRPRPGLLPAGARAVLAGPGARPPADTLEQRVFASIDALEAGLAEIADEVDILHTQDCISARAAARVRDAGAGSGWCAPCTTSTTSPPRP